MSDILPAWLHPLLRPFRLPVLACVLLSVWMRKAREIGIRTLVGKPMEKRELAGIVREVLDAETG